MSSRGPGNYVWSIPPTTGTITANANMATVTWRKIGVHTIKVDYTGGQYGCRSASSGIQVTVIPVPGQEDVIPVRNYDGTIASVRWRTSKVDGSTGEDMKGMYTFEYDDKYQLKGAQWAVPDFTLNLFNNEGDQFRIANLAYDPNGNIQSMRRYDSTGARINDFAYTYNAKISKPQQTNQLQNITGYAVYSYDTLGRLIAEDKVSGADQYIEYDVSGKVLKVFSDAAKQNAKVEYIYDDRGFRLAKKDIASGKTTWYIRDASGNLLSVYESSNGSDQAKQIEAPVYGSGKIGTYYPKQESSGYYQDGSTDYEISDHLSNVRALVRDNINSYGASMEDSGQPVAVNPRVKEMQHFINLFETEQTDVYMNHTTATTAVSNPNKSAYLFWQSGVQGTDASDKSIGPGIMLKVKAGNKVKAEAWVRYEKKASYSRGFDLLLLSQFLGTNFVGIGGFEGYTVSQASNTFQSALTGANFMSDGTDEERPFAYLNYILFNQDMTLADAGWQRIPQNAGHLSGQEALPGMHQRVAFDEALEVEANGYIYVWVSNESENTKVWFDDLKVTHQENIITQATDYGVWGDVIREQKSILGNYRYGYQGQYAERDSQTGWNHFELREYDPVIARWTCTDPEGQFDSPYIGMGNNPVNSVDPDGGYLWGWFGSTKEQRDNARRDKALYGESAFIDGITSKHISVVNVGEWYTDGIHDERYVTTTTYNADGSFRGFDIQHEWLSNLATGEAVFDPVGQLTFVPGIGQVAGVARGVSFAGRLTVTAAGRYAVRQSVKNFATFMTQRELRVFMTTSRAGVRAMMRGKGVDAAFRYYAGKNLILRGATRFGLIKLGARNKGADLLGRGVWSKYWWDVTTPGKEWLKHVGKYGPGGTGLFYK